MSNIRILVTGGTFDKEYNMITGELFFKETHLGEMLKVGRCDLDLSIRTLMMIDSLQMTDADRDIIANTCAKIDEQHIVITHGTDTMVETAKYLQERVKDKTIVLTGAMIPYKFGSSDGFFNLGSSLAFAQALEPGIYICMQGRIFDPNDCRKNKKAGIFETLS